MDTEECKHLEEREKIIRPIIQFEEGFAIEGCCGGGCCIIFDIVFCPFCGKKLINTDGKQERATHEKE